MDPAEQRVRTLVAEVAGVPAEEVGLDSTWRSLGIDSLDLFNVLLACEQEFGVEIPDEQVVVLYCVEDVVRAVRINR